jgi:WD40 repeat protein
VRESTLTGLSSDMPTCILRARVHVRHHSCPIHEARSWKAHKRQINGLLFLEEAEQVWTCSTDAHISVWTLDTAMSPTPTSFKTFECSGKVRTCECCFYVYESSAVYCAVCNCAQVLCLAGVADDRFVISGNAEPRLSVWNVKDLRQELDLDSRHRQGVRCFSNCVDGVFWSGAMNGTLCKWDVTVKPPGANAAASSASSVIAASASPIVTVSSSAADAENLSSSTSSSAPPSNSGSQLIAEDTTAPK